MSNPHPLIHHIAALNDACERLHDALWAHFHDELARHYGVDALAPEPPADDDEDFDDPIPF